MTIEEYFGTLQQSFVEIWKNHLQTSKYRDHKALNEYYDEIVDKVDSLIEAYQGIYGKVGDFKNNLKTDFDDPTPYLKELKKFTKEGRKELIDEKDTELWSTIDDILNLIDSTLYQLKEFKEDNGMKSLKDYILETLNESILTEKAYSLKKNDAFKKACEISKKNIDKLDALEYDGFSIDKVAQAFGEKYGVTSYFDNSNGPLFIPWTKEMWEDLAEDYSKAYDILDDMGMFRPEDFSGIATFR